MTSTASAVSESLLPHLRKARDHIDRRYATGLDLDGLAAVAGVSTYHFVRSFETDLTLRSSPLRSDTSRGPRTYGETPIRYLTLRRIERAQDLLRVANLR